MLQHYIIVVISRFDHLYISITIGIGIKRLFFHYYYYYYYYLFESLFFFFLSFTSFCFRRCIHFSFTTIAYKTYVRTSTVRYQVPVQVRVLVVQTTNHQTKKTKIQTEKKKIKSECFVVIIIIIILSPPLNSTTHNTIH